MSSSESPTRHPVYIHIGAAKTGTTFLQALFDDERDALRSAGLLYPPCGGSGQVLEALDLRHATFKGDAHPDLTGSWRRMVDAIREWDGPALVSSELLAPARPRHIERLLTSLSFADVHIVLTVRDLARQLPAAWQEWVKNRGTESFAEWRRYVHEPEPPNPGSHFWALHDIDRIVQKWSANIPPDRFHVITVPPPGGDRSLLWKRVSSVIGVDPDAFRQPPAAVNSSLGAAEVAALRQVNIALGGNDFPWRDYDRLVKWYLALRLAEHRSQPIELPEDEYEWAVERSRQFARTIVEAGVDVVGDLDEIVPTHRPTGLDPDHAPDRPVADAAVAGIVAMVQRLAADGAELERVRAELRTAEAALEEERAGIPLSVRTKRFLIALSDRVAWLGPARRMYSAARRRRGAG